MRILFFGTYDARVHPRVAVLREGLEELGHAVIECNVPLHVPTSERVQMLRRPWHAVSFILQMFRAWLVLWRRGRYVRSIDAVIVGYLGIFDVHLARWLWPGKIVVLDHLAPGAETAKDRGSSRLVWRTLEWADRAAVRSADIVCVDTTAHLPDVAGAVGAKNVVVPVGAPSAWFSAPRDVETSRLRVVFFGLYTPLQGAPVIGEAIRVLVADGAPIDFTMVGAGQDRLDTFHRVGAGGNVHWIDWVEPQELPDLVSRHHVCLGIFGAGDKARKVVPNKVYQGSAAGCAIVTSDTPPQREILGDVALYVEPGDPGSLADALARLSAAPTVVEDMRWRAFDLADRDFRPATVITPLDAHLRAQEPDGRAFRG